MKKILIFEPNSSQAIAISKFIKKYSDYYIVGLVESKIRFDTKNYDEIMIKKFSTVDISDYDYILPMGANSTFNIIEKHQKLLYRDRIVFSVQNLIVFDKVKMLKIAQQIDVPIPKTFYTHNEIEKFPIFYKENFENGGGVRGVANNINEIPSYNKLIYQEYIDTPSTYGVGFLAKDGEILTYTIHKEVISYPQDGGSAVVIENYMDDRLLLYSKKIIKETLYNGWGLAEFKYCNRREDFIFMEINAKFWASIEFILINNPLFLYYLLNIKYSSKKENSLLFINRLFKYSFMDIVKNYRYILNRKIIQENSLSYQVVRKIIPNQIVEILKRIVK
jgi:hypothetical protein